MRPFIQASAPYISLLCLLLSLLFLIFSINHSVAHNVSSVQRNIPHTTYTSDALTLRIESSRIAVPFGDRHASYEIGLLSNTTHNEKRLAKRESVWVDAVSEGTKYLYMLQKEKRRESYFAHWSQMTGDVSPADAWNGQGYGWVLSRGDDETPPFYGDVFDDLKIPRGAANVQWQANQNVQFRNCRRTDVDPTHGKNWAYYNVPGRAITSVLNYSPAYELKDNYKSLGEPLPKDWPTMLPDVQRWSDLVWIMWAREAGPKVGTLKYIFKHDVITHETREVMAHASGVNEDDDLPEWPGRTFKMGDSRFAALLGTPHGRGVVYLLTQHSMGLPGKSIESITVFAAILADYQLLFTLTD